MDAIKARPGGVTREQLIDSIALAISREEGFNIPGSISQRQFNPGNLTSWGVHPVVGGYVKFESNEDGWHALKQQIAKNVFTRKLTFRTFFAGQRDSDGKVIKDGYPGFSPAPVAGDRLTKGNNPAKYAQDVCDWVNHKLGAAATVDTVIYSLVTEPGFESDSQS